MSSLNRTLKPNANMNTDIPTKCPVSRTRQFIHKVSLPFRRTRKTDRKTMKRWVRGHHVFFGFIIGANISLRRATKAIRADDQLAAEHFLGQAANLMRASAVAMQLAGTINRASFEYAVVPSMQHYHPEFTGMDSEDHKQLVLSYNQLKMELAKLPPCLHGSANSFRASVDLAMDAHVHVCAYHRGAKRSPTSEGDTADIGVDDKNKTGLEKLFTLLPKRLAMITLKRPSAIRVLPELKTHTTL